MISYYKLGPFAPQGLVFNSLILLNLLGSCVMCGRMCLEELVVSSKIPPEYPHYSIKGKGKTKNTHLLGLKIVEETF